MYDSILIPCPNCEQLLEFKSRHEDANGWVYTLDTASPYLRKRISGEIFKMCDCGMEWHYRYDKNCLEISRDIVRGDLLIDVDTRQIVTTVEARSRVGRYLSYYGQVEPGRKASLRIVVPDWLIWQPTMRGFV